MKYLITLFITTLFFTTACVQQKQSKEAATNVPPSVDDNCNASTTIVMLDERLNNMDSLVFVFYKDPLGKDSLRYTRFYTQHSTTINEAINILKAQINQPTERFEKVKKCRSEGKIWCFTKGEIFQTLYFSNFDKQCSFLFFIKNGQFYYCNLTNDFKEIFSGYKILSKEIKIQ